VLLSEFIFLVPAAIKIAWFYFGSAASYLLAWQSFYVLSALSLFGPVGPDWFYALQTLNAFEIAYWFLLAYGLFKVSGLNYDKSLKVVLLSYVPALLIWVTIITFCSLLMFPATG